MRLPPILTLERVEDPVGGVAEFERVPRDRAFLRCGQLAALRQRTRQDRRPCPASLPAAREFLGQWSLPVPSSMSSSRYAHCAILAIRLAPTTLAETRPNAASVQINASGRGSGDERQLGLVRDTGPRRRRASRGPGVDPAPRLAAPSGDEQMCARLLSGTRAGSRGDRRAR